MGLTEMIVILFVLITVGQYLIGWASYFEKKYTHVSNQLIFHENILFCIESVYSGWKMLRNTEIIGI